MRVLHCPSTVGGNPQGLSRAEREHGCDSVSWTLTQNQYQYPADRVICPSGGRPLRALLRWWAIGRMVGKFDVVHFNFDGFTGQENMTATMTDFAGRIVFLGNISGNKLDISALDSGIYFLKIETEGKAGWAKLMKK